MILGEQKLSVKGVAKSFLPILLDTNWFVVIYSILYLSIPFINNMVSNISQRNYKILLVINIIFFYVWPTFLNNLTIKDNGYGIINFIVLYLIGGYLKLYSRKERNKNYYLCMYSIMSLAIWGYHEINPETGWAYNTIFCLTASICLFLFFDNIKIKNYKKINMMASTIFTVYIIHVNPFLINLIWNKLLNCEQFYQNYWFVPHMLLSSVIILGIGMLIGFLINKILDKFIKKELLSIEISLDK